MQLVRQLAGGDHLVAAAPLRLVERAVGHLEQLTRIPGVHRERGHAGRRADTGREVAAGGGRGRELGDRRPQPLGRPHAVTGAARHEHRELLTAEPRGDVRVALLPGDGLADRGQQPVAGAVPVAVVERLEPVQVEDDERDASAVAAHPGHLGAQRLGEEVVVAQARQPVGERAYGKPPPSPAAMLVQLPVDQRANGQGDADRGGEGRGRDRPCRQHAAQPAGGGCDDHTRGRNQRLRPVRDEPDHGEQTGRGADRRESPVYPPARTHDLNLDAAPDGAARGQRDQNCRRLDVASPAGCSPSPASADDDAGFSRAGSRSDPTDCWILRA